MTISNKEIDLLIHKLREKYKESAVEYKTRVFNLDAFEDRFQTALRKRMNLEGFILAEIANYEKIKQKCEEERHPKKSEDSVFSRHVDMILQENAARMEKYNEIQFHPLADFEISHFYGALSEFAFYYFSLLWIIINDYDNKDKLREFEDLLSKYAISKTKKHPKRIEDHILMLSRNETREIEIEKDKNDYLKESAFLLHEIIDFMDDLINTRNKDWENPLKFDRLYIEGETKKKIIVNFAGMTPYGAILKIKEQAEEILKDFRLESFKRKSVGANGYSPLCGIF